MTPSSLIVDRSANSRIVGVSLTSSCNCSSCKVSKVMILMAAPRYTRTRGIIVFANFYCNGRVARIAIFDWGSLICH
jgi:hypothetical protein